MEEIQNKLITVINDLFDLDIEPVVSVAPENTGADYASNVAMQLAKDVRRAPRQIAEEIASKIPDCEVAGPGFLNFKLSDEYYFDKAVSFADNFGKNISQDEYSGKTVICEFSDPNPFKVLHVGHLYTSIIGDGIARLYEFANGNVIRANFGGDVGLHVGKTLWAMLPYRDDILKMEMQDGMLEIAKRYVEGTNAYENDEKAREEITKINGDVYKMTAMGKEASLSDSQFEDGLVELYWQGREWSYQYFDDFYSKIHVKFDRYYPESTVAQRGLSEVREGLEKGVYEMSDGAVVYRGEKVGLHTRVFINKNGLPTYEAKDVGLINTKWDDYHFDKSVVITGNDIIDYMKVVLSSVKEMHPELAERTTHLTHGNVKLAGGVKMSSRKGNFLKAIDVLDMTAQLLKETNFDELAEKDKKIVIAAIKFAFLKVKIGGDVIFDPKESVSMTGCSGPYLQYSCVRAKKILDKIDDGDFDEKYQMNEWEKTLVKKMLDYSNVLGQAVKEMASNKICNYLYELAQEFSRFYENVKVAGSEFEQERKKIVQGYLNILTHGLDLLGIEVPDEM